ncbi:methionyl-tRNA formyltransferase [Candidatus Uabimicrobium amorphum]|uniref:Methionyl-tRNA formyltransferase n=1 Tax=Uabimicrobium amorphum TaxID=2596890 RepID=A0A5S9IRT4_UABAM|nr:methionyl-tRNA formyltransferase [Candidatus Uabimicrobium amorphum]BBM86953.1 methionyl-tRNA formyltransferase [Candidatus Uabimicrobium amorphum]
MKIIFWGTPEFAVPILDTLNKSSHEIVAIVSQPDKVKGRKKKLIPPEIAQYGHDHNIEVMQPQKLNKEFRQKLEEYAPDLMIVVAYGRILRQKILDIPKYGCVNVHFSLLPKYRGASPVNAAILNGDKETGITIMNMVREMDAGPILHQYITPIGAEDTTGDLLERLGNCAGQPLLEVIEKLEQKNIEPQPQDEEAVTYCGMISKKDGLINWEQPAEQIKRFVYAMSPWPSAHTNLTRNDKSDRVILHSVEVDFTHDGGKPGEVVKVDKEHVWVQTTSKTLKIKKIQKSGKSVLKVKDFLLGTKVSPGDFFG